MTVTLSTAIMHAPWARDRADTVRTLTHELRGAHRVTVVQDTKREGIWPTARRAWMAASGTHHLVLQDDAELCSGFVKQAMAAIESNPDAAISFFNFAGKAATKARDMGVPWLDLAGHATALAVAMPSSWVHPWMVWCRDHIAPDFRHDDTRLQVWLAVTDRPMWFTIPCLVDHLGDKTSIAGNRPPLPRVAPWFLREPGQIDWTRGLGDDRVSVAMKSKKTIIASCTGYRP